MPFPPKPSKKKDDEDFEHFAEMIKHNTVIAPHGKCYYNKGYGLAS